MKADFECLPCVLKTSFEAIKLATKNDDLSREIFYKLLDEMKNYQNGNPPPEIAGEFFKKIKDLTGNEDPYFAIKRTGDDFLLNHQNLFYKKIADSDDPLMSAMKFAIAGNIIDYGVNPNLVVEDEVKKIFEEANRKINHEVFDYKKLKEELFNAKSLLFIADNCGEIVLDKLFLKEIKREYPNIKITIAVRSETILNDVTMKEAKYCGLDEIGDLIESGSIYPGTLLQKTNENFKEIFDNADIVLSKGQGNFETMNDNKTREIYFLFLIKCKIVVFEIKQKLGKNSNLFDIALIKC